MVNWIYKIHDGSLAVGQHELSWDLKNKNGARVKPGVYICRYIGGDEAGSLKIITR